MTLFYCDTCECKVTTRVLDVERDFVSKDNRYPFTVTIPERQCATCDAAIYDEIVDTLALEAVVKGSDQINKRNGSNGKKLKVKRS